MYSTGSEPLCELLADLYTCGRLTCHKMLFICVDTDKFNALDIFIYHAVYRIISAAADTYYHYSCSRISFIASDL